MLNFYNIRDKQTVITQVRKLASIFQKYEATLQNSRLKILFFSKSSLQANFKHLQFLYFVPSPQTSIRRSKMKRLTFQQNIQNVNLNDITPLNFQLPTRYPCIICYQRCIDPLSCNRCNQIICTKHIQKINNKCPNCRLTPFQFTKDEFSKRVTQHQLQKQRDILVSKATFTCLVQGCNFQGKYHKMDLHKRKFHRNEELKDILFPDERQKKKRKETIQKLFLKLLILKQQQTQFRKKAKQIYDSSQKKLSLGIIEKMLWHTIVCSNNKCKQVYILKDMCFIGDNQKNISQCLRAKNFIRFFDE